MKVDATGRFGKAGRLPGHGSPVLLHPLVPYTAASAWRVRYPEFRRVRYPEFSARCVHRSA